MGALVRSYIQSQVSYIFHRWLMFESQPLNGGTLSRAKAHINLEALVMPLMAHDTTSISVKTAIMVVPALD